MTFPSEQIALFPIFLLYNLPYLQLEEEEHASRGPESFQDSFSGGGGLHYLLAASGMRHSITRQL